MKKVIYVLLFLAFVSFANAQWVQMNGLGNSTNVTSLASNSNYIFAGLKFTNKGVYRSSDNGSSWSTVSLNSYDIYSIATSGNNVFVGTYSNGIHRSTDNGTTYTQVFTTAYSGEYCITINGSNIYAGCYYQSGGAVYLSANNGTNWTLLSSQIGSSVKSLAINGSNIIAGTMSGVFLSTNNGATFTQTSLNNRDVRSLAIFSSTVVFAGTRGYGVYVSGDNGSNWTQLTSLSTEEINSLVVINTQVFCGTSGAPSSSGNFYKYFGSYWVPKNEGLPTTNFGINALLVANNYFFMGTQSWGFCRRQASEVIGIQNISTEIPSSYSLQQNYPNPFNPSTIIRFQIKDSRFVTLKVFDILGKEVATLVNEKQTPGTYEVDWNASQYPSGVYFYKLQSGDFVDTKRMILIK